MYTRVFSAILDSSIWQQELHVRCLWIVMLIIADENRDGTVNVPISRLAQKANLTEEQTRSALDILMQPDPESDSPEEEGRRVMPLVPDRPERGWRLVNWSKYKKIANEEQRREQVAENMRKYRARKSGVMDGDQALSERYRPVIPTEAEATASSDSKDSSSSASPPPSSLRKGKEAKSWQQGDEPYDLACLLFENLRKRKADWKKPNLQEWARQMHFLTGVDGRSAAAIRDVLRWLDAYRLNATSAAAFWSKNILSPKALRAQFDRLESLMRAESPQRRPVASAPMLTLPGEKP